MDMEPKKAKKISIAIDLILTAIVYAIGGATILDAWPKKDPLSVGIAVGAMAWVTYGTYRAITRTNKLVEETYDRYCVQVANGPMTDFPNVVKQECLKSIDAAKEWIKGNKSEGQSYRVIDMADGAVIILNGVSVAKKEALGYRAKPPLGADRR
jgi:hypothetical protein